MRLPPIARKMTGFSLIEVLVALMVISVGLLGIAKMQALSQSNTQTSGSRAIASILAASLASAMHANKLYWAAGTFTGSITVVGTAVTGDSGISSQSTDCAASGSICTPVATAAYDLGLSGTNNANGWGPSLANLLPSGTGAVVCTTSLASPISCDITVNWFEKSVALNPNASTASSTTQSFTLLVQP